MCVFELNESISFKFGNVPVKAVKCLSLRRQDLQQAINRSLNWTLSGEIALKNNKFGRMRQ